MMLLKKTVYDKWVTKVNAIDTSWFVLKAQYNIDKSGLQKKLVRLPRKYLIPVDFFKNRL